MNWPALLSGVAVAAGLWLLIDSARRSPRDLVPLTVSKQVGVSVAARRARALEPSQLTRNRTSSRRPLFDARSVTQRWSLHDRMEGDLRVVDDTFESVLSQQLVLAVAGFAAPPIFLLLILPLAGFTTSPAVALLLGVVGALAGFFAPMAELRRQAEARRLEFAASLSHYVSFVEVMVSGGHSIDSAFEFAADLGDGWAWEELRFAIASASSATQAPYRALQQLGDELQIPELITLSRRLGQTQSSGAAIGPALRVLADTLAADRARRAKVSDDQITEKMTFPLMVILLSLLTFFGIAAVAAILRAAQSL